MADELTQHDVETLGQLFASKSLSPRELLEHVLDRIERFGESVNAFNLIDAEGARAAAARSEERWHAGRPLGPLDGIPTTIKDIVWSQDWPTTFGSKVLAMKEPAPEDAPCIARLKEAGAVLIGFTTTPEIGWKAITDSPHSGITRNPWDLSRTTGGSSGGAAAAAALGFGSLHLGTDGGGSIRIPSSFTGVVGHKPSFGRVPAYPISAFGTVSHQGPMARSVGDAAAMLTILAGPDPRDWYALPAEEVDYRDGLDEGVAGLRIAYSETLGFLDVDSEVAACVRRAALGFEALGATVEAVDPPFGNPQQIFHRLWFAGAVHRLREVSEEQRRELDPGLAEIAETGASFSLQDYQVAVDERTRLGTIMRQFHEDYDLLVTPSVSIPAFTAGQETPAPTPGDRWTDWAGFSYPFNLTQQPACSVPCGLTDLGLPIGLQIVGPMHADALVLRAARAYEATRDWPLPDEPRGQ